MLINPKYSSVKHEKVDLKYAIVHILRTLETRVNLKPIPGGGAVNPIFRQGLISRPNGEDPGKKRAKDILKPWYVWSGISNKIIATWFDLPTKP